MSDILKMMEEDFEQSASSIETLDNAGLNTVAGLARKIKHQQDKVERLDRYPADQNESIHAGTLKAFVKERIESGDDFPHDIFGAYVGQRAIIRGVK